MTKESRETWWIEVYDSLCEEIDKLAGDKLI